MRGTIKKLGLEGGLWVLLTEDGQTVELVDPPRALMRDGVRVSIVADRSGVDVTVGMVGDAVRVRSYELL